MDRHGTVFRTNRISLCMNRVRQQRVNLLDGTRLWTRLGVVLLELLSTSDRETTRRDPQKFWAAQLGSGMWQPPVALLHVSVTTFALKSVLLKLWTGYLLLLGLS